MKTQIDHPQIGPVTVVRSKRARRISISVRPGDRVRLTVPWAAAVREALTFLDSRAEWVTAAKEKVAARVKPEPVIEMPYHTRSHELRFEPSPTERVTVRVREGIIRITYPLEEHYASPGVQQAARKGIEQAWRLEAAEMLPGRLSALAAEHGLRYRAVTVRNTRSRWGSCSSRDDISLSIRLMKLPDELIDYILLHELCHTVHKNHGPKFHALLDRVTGGRHAGLRRRMRDFR